MRLASFSQAGRSSFGVVLDTGLVDVGARTGAASLKTVLEGGSAALEPFAAMAPDLGFDDVAWAAPIPDPTHIIGIGLNTRSHFDETAVIMKRAAEDLPKRPRLFTRSPFSQVAHEAALVIPHVSSRLDYE